MAQGYKLSPTQRIILKFRKSFLDEENSFDLWIYATSWVP